MKVDELPCAVVCFNDRAIIVEANSAFCALTGYEAKEVAGQKFESLLNVGGRIFFQTHFFPMLKMHASASEIFLELQARDKSIVPMICNARRDPDTGSTIAVLMEVHNRRKYEDELLEAKRKIEQSLKESSELIAAREQAERHARELDLQLGRINTINEELRQFSDIINHDMQECIRKIITFTHLGMPGKAEQYFPKIHETAMRLRKVNAALHLFVSIGSSEPALHNADLERILKAAEGDVVREYGRDSLRLTISKLPVVQGDNVQLQMMFMHLLQNAVQHRVGDTVNVSVEGVVYEDNLYQSTEGRYVYGEVVRITVKDDGSGFDNKYKDYVFQLLKKMDGEDPRMGMGLALCKKIVDNHSGQISVNSSPGKGTEVMIVLPLRQLTGISQ